MACPQVTGQREQRSLLIAALVLAALAGSASGRSAVNPSSGSQPAVTQSKPLQQIARPSPSPSPAKSAKPAIDDQDIEVVRVNSNLVVVPVSVTDPQGQPVLGLKPVDFRLEEEGKKQEIAQIGDPDQVPLDIAILLDVSGSVSARFGFEQDAAARFLKQVLKPVDTAAVFAIDTAPRLEQSRTTAELAAAKLLSMVSSHGATAFYDTVIDAAQYLAKNTPARHRRVIVVISDGEDNYSDKVKAAIGATAEAQHAATPAALSGIHERLQREVLREVQRADTVFYSINPSGDPLHINYAATRAEMGMERLANATGGAAFVPDKPEDLNRIFTQIANELRAQYLLQYYSEDESPSGKFLRIDVSTPAHSQLRIRARQGYYTKRK